MNIGKRNLNQLTSAILGRQHYIALINMIRIYPNFINVFLRYFFGIGEYPYRVKIRTLIGVISPKVFSYYDILTVNEIFCRLDYGVKKDVKVIVDVGSNIGISALYFLSRNKISRCYLFEPVPENISKIHINLEDFKDRYYLEEVAVSDKDGVDKFGTEEYGRCGGLKRETGLYIEVTCVHINNVLQKILQKEELIDVLKIDTEGSELDIINSLDKKYLPRIKNIFFEIDHSVEIKPETYFLQDYYNQKRYGNTIKLSLKSK